MLPQVSLKWNQGVNNFMVYGTGDIPVGDYDLNRLANLGIGHGAIDGGAGYTYFNPHTGNEFSAVVGVTYNLKNTNTQYQNGMDFHFDWGASHFVTKQWQLGFVGYYFQQVTDDFGAPAVARRLQLAHRRHRPPDRLHLPARRQAGISEPEGLQGVRGPEPPRGLESCG